MAIQTPLVQVFQQLTSSVVTADEPTLQSLIAGPAYHIQDYPLDADNISIGTYGTLTGANAPLSLLKVDGVPATGADAVVVPTPPNNVVGALLDHASVTIYASDVRVLVVNSDADGAFSASPNDNVFMATGATFGAAGVRPGDRLVATDPASNITVDRTVLEVGGIQGSTLTVDTLTVTSNYAAAGTDISGVAYTGAALTGLDWRIERSIDDAIEISASYVVLDDNELTIEGGVTHLMDITEDGVDDIVTVVYGELYMEYCALRQDLALVKQVDDNTVDDVLGRQDERNPLRVAAGLALANSGGFPVYVFGVVGDDLNGVADTVSAYDTMYELLEPQEDVFAIAPMTSNTSVVSAGLAHVNEFSSPAKSKFRILLAGQGTIPTTKSIGSSSLTGESEQVVGDAPDVLVSASFDLVSSGVRANDALYITADTAGTSRVGVHSIENVHDSSRLRSASVGAVGASETGDIAYWVFRGATGTVSRATTGTVDSGSANAIELPAGLGDTGDIGKVIRLIQKVSDSSAPTDDAASPTSDNYYLVTGVSSDTYTVIGGAWSATAEALQIEIVDTLESSGAAAVTAVHRAPFRQLLDNSASFVSAGAVVSDFLQLASPAVSEGADFSGTLYSATIEAVVSNARLRLSVSTDIPTTNNVTGQTDIGYRVQRALDRPGQVEELEAIVGVTGYNEKRLFLMMPDALTLSDVTNAKTGVKSRTPGHYLAAVVAGMSAGLPPQQGLTNLSIVGVDEIHNSSRYFTQDQLESISNAGYFLFVQPTTVNPPYILHQVSTDTSSLLNSEFSMIRSYDYVSRFFKKIVDEFIGKYNINADTLDLLRGSIENGIDTLRSDKLPKIGAPLTDATIVTLEQVEGQADQVELVLDADLPTPLNRVRLVITA